MIADLISDIFERIGHTWKIGGKHLTPTEEDVDEVLDKAAAELYDGDEGDRFELGGVIIEKRNSGHDVYVFIGNYE